MATLGFAPATRKRRCDFGRDRAVARNFRRERVAV
jgi:hypothetical protein